jgi:putative lipoprotein
MPKTRFLIFALLPLFAGCQLFSVYDSTPAAPVQRLQGKLTQADGRLLLTTCGEQRHIALINDGSSDIAREAGELFADGQDSLFVDLLGTLSGSQAAGLDGELRPSEVYRLQGEGPGCHEPGFERLLLRASGHEPDWSLGVSGQGLVLLRPGQQPLALPYLEEQLPEGRFNISSEANGQRLELWLAPQRCVDSMSGTVQHLSAELRINGEVQRGCASFGGARNR